jgi:hypothetical protein
MTLVDVPNNFSPGRNNAPYRDAFGCLCKPAYKRVLGPPNVEGSSFDRISKVMPFL